MSVDERIGFATTSMLVSRAWQAEYLRASTVDIHIPCESYFYQHIMVKGSCGMDLGVPNGAHAIPVFTVNPSIHVHLHLCRSLAINLHTPFDPHDQWYTEYYHMDSETHRHQCDQISSPISSRFTRFSAQEAGPLDPLNTYLMDQSSRLTLLEGYIPSFCRLLPNLSTFHLYHRNFNPMDPTDIRWRFRDFPVGVTELGLAYAYETYTPVKAVEWFKKAKWQDHRPWNHRPSAGDEPPSGFYLPQLKALKIHGASPESRAPGVRTILTDADVSEEDLIRKLQDRNPEDVPAVIPFGTATLNMRKAGNVHLKPLPTTQWQALQALFSGWP
jgi:hypothetical protein